MINSSLSLNVSLGRLWFIWRRLIHMYDTFWTFCLSGIQKVLVSLSKVTECMDFCFRVLKSKGMSVRDASAVWFLSALGATAAVWYDSVAYDQVKKCIVGVAWKNKPMTIFDSGHCD